MRQSHVTLRQLDGQDQTIVAERVIVFLKQRHPHFTAKSVSRETDIPRNTVAKWIERGSAPSAAALARLIQVYKADLLIAILGGAEQWLAVAAFHERRSRFTAEQAAFEAEMNAALFGEARS